MERLLVICIAAALGTGFYYWFSRMLKKDRMQDFVFSHQWLLHPNAICYWRTGMAMAGFFLYFATDYQSAAIIIFTVAAIMDGVDGLVARGCNLVSRLGEWLDPLCDKLTYLPPLLGFAYTGIISIKLVWILVGIEIFGQFAARRLLNLMKSSGAANNFGKIKAIICFALVIFCALVDANPHIIHMGNQILLACVILSGASIVFKFIPNRLYADILSLLNFLCGLASLVLTYQGFFGRAVIIIIMGQLFDLFDGRMAEKHGGTKYGPYLDDIADFVSFGIAPAYMLLKIGHSWAWVFALIYITGVAFRLIRFLFVDKNRTDLPPGVFNGLPCPAGALLLLGAILLLPAPYVWPMVLLTTGLMVGTLRFAHLGRLILKQVPKPAFYTISAAVIVIIAFVLKTRNEELFGGVILGSVLIYMVIGRVCIQKVLSAESTTRH
ncbi:MAG: CDP-alcohol phosphatidyltransferase family protein [Desulfotignum sp.]|nr:CDP-alcohol phosphatidyltransferase family protein [Desulfotignum sp.]MCF8138044.1 CDP-alcohol phosphatidyltransferase family protein [Desulfotignum sp.]